MAKRYPFILTQDDGLTPAKMEIVKDKLPGNPSTPTYGDFHVYRDGVHDTDIYVYSNADGAYYFEYTLKGIYDVKIGTLGVGHAYQDELKNINLVGGTAVEVNDIVDDVASTDVDKPLSANQGKHLEDDKAEQTDLDTLETSVSDHIADSDVHASGITPQFTKDFSLDIAVTATGDFNGAGDSPGYFPVGVACKLTKIYVWDQTTLKTFTPASPISFAATDTVKVIVISSTILEVYRSGSQKWYDDLALTATAVTTVTLVFEIT